MCRFWCARYLEEEGCAGGCRAESAGISGIFRYGNQIWHESVGGDCASPVVPSAHAHASSYPHEHIGAFAHEEKCGGFRILGVAELVGVECNYEVA